MYTWMNGLLLTITMTAAMAQGAEYVVTDLGTLGGTSASAGTVNNEGQVVGSSTVASAALHAYVWEGGAMTDLGTPSGYLVSYAASINDSGLIVGSVDGQSQSQYGYMYENGVWTYLGTLPGPDLTYSSARDVNNAGQIVGYSFTLGSGGDTRSWVWQDGVMTDLGAPAGHENAAFGLNETGQVVGWREYSGSNPGKRAFRWDAGVFIDLGALPDASASSASDINDLGQVCGASSFAVPPYFSVSRACLWDGGAVVDLGSLPGYSASASTALNNHGQVVGWVREGISGGATAAFIWEDGLMRDLNTLIAPDAGWDLWSAGDINDAGQIVGQGKAPSGQAHAFLLTPCGGTDSDCDGDVDLDDFTPFLGCLTGPAQPVDPLCHDMDFDDNGHVDMADVNAFVAAFTGS